MQTRSQNQRGGTVVTLLAVLCIILSGITGWLVYTKIIKDTYSPKTYQPAGDTDEDDQETDTANGISGLQLKSRNVERRNDASGLLTYTAEYVANNNGQLPQAFEDGELIGGEYPSQVSLKRYTDVAVEIGAQPAVYENVIVLALQAVCGTDGTAVEGSSSREYAVLYGLEQADGSYKPACQDY